MKKKNQSIGRDFYRKYNMKEMLVSAIAEATKKSYTELLCKFPGNFYYFVLTTTHEGHPPSISAWSTEALHEIAMKESDYERAIASYKWSYGDSPYFCFGEDHFTEVIRLFSRRPNVNNMTAAEYRDEVEFRIRAMVEAMKKLNDAGLFGSGSERDKIFINVEVNPPDYANTLRAKYLNTPSAMQAWECEMSETE